MKESRPPQILDTKPRYDFGKKKKNLNYDVIHNISPSSGSLPSAVTVLVSLTACLVFFLDFFTCMKRNSGHKGENNASVPGVGDAAHMVSYPRTSTGQATPC